MKKVVLKIFGILIVISVFVMATGCDGTEARVEASKISLEVVCGKEITNGCSSSVFSALLKLIEAKDGKVCKDELKETALSVISYYDEDAKIECEKEGLNYKLVIGSGGGKVKKETIVLL